MFWIMKSKGTATWLFTQRSFLRNIPTLGTKRKGWQYETFQTSLSGWSPLVDVGVVPLHRLLGRGCVSDLFVFWVPTMWGWYLDTHIQCGSWQARAIWGLGVSGGLVDDLPCPFPLVAGLV